VALNGRFKKNGIPVLGPLVARFNQFLTGVDIGPGAEIGPGLRIAHGTGIVIGGYSKIGRNALLLHQVTIGAPSPERVAKMPVIGDNVFIGAGAKLIGGIRVGDNVFIGVNAIVAQNIPDNSRVLCTSGVEIKDIRRAGEPGLL